jgi:hypothetical protein
LATRLFAKERLMKSAARSNLAHALDAGLRLCFNRASLARASEAAR